MEKTRAFGQVLSRIRREQGFPRPHVFYMSREGRENLGITFRSYLNLEQGRSLPKARTVRAILRALGVGARSPEAQELAQAYFSALDLADLAGLLQASRAEDPKEMAQVARRELRRRAAQLSLKQWRVLAGNPDANACHCYLVNTPGGAAPAELARKLRLSSSAVQSAIKTLRTAGLARATRTRVRSSLEGTALLDLPAMTAMKEHAAALERQREHQEQRARSMRNAVIMARLTPASLAGIEERFDQLLDFVSMCEGRETSADSAIYEVQARILDLFPDA